MDIGKWILSLGGNFALPIDPKSFPLIKLLVDTEDCINLIPEYREKELARARMASILDKHISANSKLTPFEKTILRIHNDCIAFLKSHPNVIILPADKGGATVAMYKDEYHQKMLNILNDRSTYQPLNRCPLTKLQTSANTLIGRLCREEVIDEFKRRRMIAYNTQTPRIRAQPKVHKENLPLRHIVPTMNSPASNLSIFMDGILKKILHKKYDIPNSVALIDKLNNIVVNEDETLISFDVVSLFPSIPVEYTLNVLKRRWNEIQQHTNMSYTLFADIMRFILADASFFTYNDTVYKQIDGIAMGSNIAPTVANIITDELFDLVLPKLTFKPKLLAKYVDDILAIVPKNEVETVLHHLNSEIPSIKFTYELEHTDGTLPYLDVKLIRCTDGTIKTDWYNKEIAANKLLNFHSNHPIRMKLNVAFNFFYRVLSLSSDCFHTDNIKKVTNILRQNSYPLNVILKQQHRAYNHIKNNTNTTTQSTHPNITDRPKYRSVIYIRNLSENVNKLITNTIKDVQIASKPYRQLKSSLHTNMKQKTNTDDTINCVYKIPCCDCDQCYIGQTKNCFKSRKRTHVRDIQPNNNKGQTALAIHVKEKEHQPNFDDASILAIESNWSKRLTTESLHIQTNNTFNIREDREKISATYCALLKRHINT